MTEDTTDQKKPSAVVEEALNEKNATRIEMVQEAEIAREKLHRTREAYHKLTREVEILDNQIANLQDAYNLLLLVEGEPE